MGGGAVSPGDPPGPTTSWRDRLTAHSRALVLLVVLTALLVAGTLIHPAYVVIRPGPAINTLGQLDGTRIVEVKDAPTFPTEGELTFTTVAVYGGPGQELTLWEYLMARARPGADIRPRAEYYPPEATREQVNERSHAQMAFSQQEAVAVALRATGRPVPETITIGQVSADGPANGLLREGDVVLAANGTTITGAGQLREIISSTPDGQRVSLVVRRGEASVPVQVGTTMLDGRRLIGVYLGISYEFPVDVSIHAADVGGPSAGLMFALGVYDVLTPGALTGGQDIAGTGTIADDGAVGPVGGVPHKMVGAKDSGASWFLSPRANCADVTGQRPEGLRIVPVDTFERAKRAVEEIASGRGEALPSC